MKAEERTQIIQELHEKYPILEIIKFTEFNIYEKLQENSYQYMLYKDLYYSEKSALDHMLTLKEQMAGKLYDKLRFHDDRNLTKNEIEKYYINNDAKMIQLNKLIEKQQVKVEFFELAAESVAKMGWSMKSYLDAMKTL
jgi:hypothetical protein